jgi:outer membrane lipoprotein-sorting protein
MKMRTFPVLTITCLVAALSSIASAQNSPQLTAILAKMDAASKTFKSAQADFQWDYYEKIVHDTSTQTGSIYFQRDGASTDMGAVIVKPAAKVVEYKAGTVRMFDSGVNQVTVVHTAANQAEGFLTLGFGGSGSDLAKVWNITDQGAETVDGISTEKLDLVGKDEATRKNFTHVTIWVDPSRAISLKQIFYQSGGNYRTATYMHVKLNGSIDKGKFAMKTDKKTQTVNH